MKFYSCCSLRLLFNLITWFWSFLIFKIAFCKIFLWFNVCYFILIINSCLVTLYFNLLLVMILSSFSLTASWTSLIERVDIIFTKKKKKKINRTISRIITGEKLTWRILWVTKVELPAHAILNCGCGTAMKGKSLASRLLVWAINLYIWLTAFLNCRNSS